jgi:hypothetical protein
VNRPPQTTKVEKMPAPTASSSRALAAILPLITSGQPYEAHQKARTFASRYSKSGQYDVAIDVLFESARELLKVGQCGSGVDLAGFMLDVYESKGEVVCDESRGLWNFILYLLDFLLAFFWWINANLGLYFGVGRLTQLIALTGPSGSWRKTIIDKSISSVNFLPSASPNYSSNDRMRRWLVDGQRNMGPAQQGIQISNTTSVNFYTKVRSHSSIFNLYIDLTAYSTHMKQMETSKQQNHIFSPLANATARVCSPI